MAANDYHLEDDGWEPDCEREERAFIERSGREGRGSDHLLMGKARSRVRTTRALLVIGAPLLAARIPIFAHIRSLHMMIDPANGM